MDLPTAESCTGEAQYILDGKEHIEASLQNCMGTKTMAVHYEGCINLSHPEGDES